ncbi:MAG: IS1634 family transposase, partial [Pedobacter sp.]
VDPDSKLATTRWWRNTTLPEVFDVTGAGEDELYCAMDWLQTRQGAIEKKLASRHLQEGEMVLFEFTHPDYL